MTHSHLVVEHLLKQVESFRERRDKRDPRPEWLNEFIQDAAELFEPLQYDVGRVGFECVFSGEVWSVALFLGRTEIVGGRLDGESRPNRFQFDLQQLLSRFETVENCHWHACPADEIEQSAQQIDSSYLLVEGRVTENQGLRVCIYAQAPPEVGPGLRRFPDGQFKPV